MPVLPLCGAAVWRSFPWCVPVPDVFRWSGRGGPGRFVPTLVEHFTDLHSAHAWTLRVQAKATSGPTRAVGKEAREMAARNRQPPGAGHRVKIWGRSVTAIPQP
ncbi:hypothetical protein GCM10009601_56450 [Streptomyces thermospinosisporus]|uniref:Secreted protein n=1 Tax=Streptomyces thermospinosisporus TaxID=161482 RepID=A0ABN1Z6M5_9ACTN